MTERPISPFYDLDFANGIDPNQPAKTSRFHITGPCEAAYSRGCRCLLCRQAHREGSRRRAGYRPSRYLLEIERLNRELDAAQQENAMLRCRLQELEP